MATRTPHFSATHHDRDFERLSAHGLVYFSTDDRIGTGRICNVSLGGWKVCSGTHVDLGASLTLFATLLDHKEAVLVDDAKVCWSRGNEFGLAIRKIARPDAERLKGFIAAHS